jgi:hypothetical protein
LLSCGHTLKTTLVYSETAESTLHAVICKLHLDRTIRPSTESEPEDQKSTRYPRYNRNLAKEKFQSRNDGLSAEGNPTLIVDSEARYQECSSTSLKDILGKFPIRSDHTIDPCLGASLFQYENLQLDRDERTRSISTCELLKPCNSDSLFYVIDPDDLEYPTVSQLTDSSAQHLRNDLVLITEKLVASNSGLRQSAKQPRILESPRSEDAPFRPRQAV